MAMQQPHARVILGPGDDEPSAARQHRDVAARRVDGLKRCGGVVDVEGAHAGAEDEEVVAVEVDGVGLGLVFSTYCP